MLFRSIPCRICPQKGWLAQLGLTSLKKIKNKILHARFSLGFTFTFIITPQNPKSPTRLSLSICPTPPTHHPTTEPNFSHPSHPQNPTHTCYRAPTRIQFLPFSQMTNHYNPVHQPPRSSSAAALHALFPYKKLLYNLKNF